MTDRDRSAGAVARAAAVHPDAADIAAIVNGTCGRPFEVLGPHAVKTNGEPAVAIRAFLPQARAACVKRGKKLVPMQKLDPAGFFEAIIPGIKELRAGKDGDTAAAPETPTATVDGFRYHISYTAQDGTTMMIDDAYRFPPILTDFDLHLFCEGTHVELYAKLGAHVMKHDGVRGVAFAVWAPNAARVSVIGDFDRWDERRHPMRLRENAGVWELFIPGLGAGELYKYHILTRLEGGGTTVKADPFGFAMELRPNTASVVYDLSRYRWRDEEWMRTRAALQSFDAPINIYEVHLGSWKRRSDESNRWLTYRELARELVPYAKSMGYTHLELLPITEHPFDGSWGYQTAGYFAPTSRFGTPDDFRAFIDAAHRAGLSVILDWVPGHFPKDAHGLGFFDGTHLYEHADPRKGLHQDWDTFIYNFGRPQVRAFLYSNALFWMDEYHADGLRVDAVASMLYLDYSRKQGEWIPNQYGGRENLEAVAFLKELNVLLHHYFPDARTYAEESTAWPHVSRPVDQGGLGFDFKWNMGWMHDTLSYMKEDPVNRRYHHQKLTFSLLYAFSERFVLPLSHDEVVHGKRSLLMKMPGDKWRKHANLRTLYGYMYAHPGKKLLFMGCEVGQRREWHHDRQLDWDLLEDELHAGLQRYVRDLNHVYLAQRALHEVDFDPEGFEWIDFRDEENSILAFLRRGKRADECVLMVANFTPVPRHAYRVGVPTPGRWKLLLNSDAHSYGGSDLGMVDGADSEPTPWQQRPHSILLTLPPLGVLLLALDTTSATI